MKFKLTSLFGRLGTDAKQIKNSAAGQSKLPEASCSVICHYQFRARQDCTHSSVEGEEEPDNDESTA